MIWRNPVAWLGLATLLIPLAIHLLVRHRAEPRPFPSLRFVQPTRLASVRRKLISDWPLLVIRMAILAFAVAALADPLWQSAARRAEWNTRQARAIVVDTTASVAADPARALVQREAAGAFRAETFQAKDLAEGIRRASDWLRTAPPARRELVVISDFQLGALDPRAFHGIPAHVGIRLAKTSGAPATRTAKGRPRTHRPQHTSAAGVGAAASATAATAATAAYAARTPRVTINSNDTAVTWTESDSAIAIDATGATTGATDDGEMRLRPFDVMLRGSAADRPFLLAAAEAVLAQGVPVAGSSDTRSAVTVIVATEATGVPASANDAGTLSAPWQSDIARAIATDVPLSRAVGRATTAAAMMAGPISGSASAPSEAAAKPRGASNGSGDVPAPWIVLMRDGSGMPAILAAAEGGRADSRMLVWSRVAARDEATALLIRATLRALAGADAFGEAEVIAIPDATLAQWQRPASEPPASEWGGVERGDRRWLWGAVLVLLIAEQILRRRARHREAQPDRPGEKVLEHAA